MCSIGGDAAFKTHHCTGVGFLLMMQLLLYYPCSCLVVPPYTPSCNLCFTKLHMGGIKSLICCQSLMTFVRHLLMVPQENPYSLPKQLFLIKYIQVRFFYSCHMYVCMCSQIYKYDLFSSFSVTCVYTISGLTA